MRTNAPYVGNSRRILASKDRPDSNLTDFLLITPPVELPLALALRHCLRCAVKWVGSSDMRMKNVESQHGTRLVYVLSAIAKPIGESEIQKRVEAALDFLAVFATAIGLAKL